MVPIMKKGQEEKVEDYRGIIMPTLYKVYIAERLRKEMEGKRMISPN